MMQTQLNNLWRLLLIVLGTFFSTYGHAGAISKSIQLSCPKQYAQHEDTVQTYAIRMRDYVESYGCGIVSAYAAYIKSDEDMVAQWEDNEEVFPIVNQVFLLADEHHLDLSNTPLTFQALFQLMAFERSHGVSQINQVFANMTQQEKLKIKNEPAYILYILWASQLVNGSSPDQVLIKANALQQNISLQFLPAALLLDTQIASVYPEYSPRERLQEIDSLFKSYPRKFMEKVVSNQQSLLNLIYLLPPSAQDINNAQNLSDYDLRRLRRNYIDVMYEVITSFEHAVDDFGVATDSGAVLAPFILAALIDGKKDNIITYLKAQIHSSTFESYLKKKINCSKENFSNHVATFFTFLAPQQRSGDKLSPISHLQNNLLTISNWYAEDKNMRDWVADTAADPLQFINNIALLPYYRTQISSKGKTYLSKLFIELPSSYNVNASFILALLQQSDYFDWVATANDANKVINANDYIDEATAPKYIYIINTPFPSRLNASVFDRFIENRSGIPLVSQLQKYSISDLAAHNFTTKEKLLSALDTLDNVITVVAIVAIPVTGGASLLIVASKQAAKQATKRGVKHGLKVAARYLRKKVSQNTRATVRKLSGKDGRKAFVREGKELIGLTEKRGRPSSYSNGKKTMTKLIRRGDSAKDLLLGAYSIGAIIYCKLLGTNSPDASMPNTCFEQDHASKAINMCQYFKIRSNP